MVGPPLSLAAANGEDRCDMVSKNSKPGGRTTSSGRVGRFHFAPSGPRQYRLVAILLEGEQLQLRKGSSIGALWRCPLVIDPEIESQVIGLRVEQRPETPVEAAWKPLLSCERPRRDADGA
jgi:hypothetical protein